MVLWSEVDKNLIEITPGLKDKSRFRYQGGPLRFQIPRAWSNWGVSAYKSMNVDIRNTEFVAWWRDLETRLCSHEPFNSNLKEGSLRLKVDDAMYVFDENAKQVCPEVREGLFRAQEVQCIIDVDSTYFFNGNWGLTIRIYQLKTLGPSAAEPSVDEPPVTSSSAGGLKPGVCAFLPSDD